MRMHNTRETSQPPIAFKKALHPHDQIPGVIQRLIPERLLNAINIVVPSPSRYQPGLKVSPHELDAGWRESRGKLLSQGRLRSERLTSHLANDDYTTGGRKGQYRKQVWAGYWSSGALARSAPASG